MILVRLSFTCLVLQVLIVCVSSRQVNAQHAVWEAYQRAAVAAEQHGEIERSLKLHELALHEAASLESRPECLAETYENLAVLCFHQGDFHAAGDWFVSLLRVCEDEEIGEADGRWGRALDGLAGALHKLGHSAEAEELVRAAIETHDDRPNASTAELAGLLNNLAVIQHSQGKLDEAEATAKHSLVLSEKSSESKEDTHANRLETLAGIYHTQGKNAQAVALAEQALRMTHDRPRSDDRVKAAIHHRLGAIHHTLENHSDAERHYRYALEIREQRLPDEHPDVSETKDNLRVLLESAHRRALSRNAEPRPDALNEQQWCKELIEMGYVGKKFSEHWEGMSSAERASFYRSIRQTERKIEEAAEKKRTERHAQHDTPGE